MLSCIQLLKKARKRKERRDENFKPKEKFLSVVNSPYTFSLKGFNLCANILFFQYLILRMPKKKVLDDTVEFSEMFCK